MKGGFQIASAVFAFVAGVLWFFSAIVRVRYKDSVGSDGMIEANIIVDGADFIKTIQRQSFWSAMAALVACGAAFCQFIVILL